MSFEENGGQADARVKFLSRGRGYALALTEDEVVLAVKKKGTGDRGQGTAGKKPSAFSGQPSAEGKPSANSRQPTARKEDNGEAALLRMRFAGGNTAAQVEGLEALPGKVYYVTDLSQKGPLNGNRTFRRVRYTDVYPGIDTVYHGDNERLEFDFVVAPHTDPNQIRLAFTGADQIALADNGDLVLHVAGEEVRLLKPVIYQERDGERCEISGGFLLSEDSTARFTVGHYDPALPLVIDPTIHFATYIGTGAFDSVVALETDATGATYILGSLGDVVSGGAAISFPFWQTFPDFFSGAGASGCYLAKLRPNGSAGVTYDYVALFPQLGCEAMAVAPNGDVSIAGPAGLPLQTVVQTFSNAGGSLARTGLFFIPLQSTRQLRVDASGNIYALGLCSQEATPGTFWPLPGGFQPSPAAGLCNDPNQIGGLNSQSVLIVTDAAGQIIYGTFLGDGLSLFDPTAMQIDSVGKAHIAGQTDAGLNFVTPNAVQSQPGDTNCQSNCGPGDAFLMVIDPAQSGTASLSYSSYFGGTNSERDISMTLDGVGLVYLAGNTDSRSTFPGTGFNDSAIFLSVLDISQAGATQLLSSVAVVESPLTTLLPWLESGPTLRLLSDGRVALMANSTDSSFPLVNPLFSVPYNPNAQNVVRPLLLVYDPPTATFTFATFLDDVQIARFPHIATFGADNLYVAMVTTETNRSKDSSPTFGQEDVLLFGITGISGSGGGNQPPTVFIPFVSPILYADSPSGANLNLNAIASDPEGDPLTYSWSGPFTNNPVTTDDFLQARLALGLQQTITVTVTDDHGNSASASVTVDVIGTSCAAASATPVDSTTNAGIFNYAPLTFTAAGVSAGGCTAFLTTHLDQIPPIPSNLQAGSPPIYFDVSFSGASLVVPIDVCIDTRGMSFPNPSSIRLHHYQISGQLAFWNDITTAGYPQGNQICGQTNSLGTFAIFYPQVPQTAIETIAGNGVLAGSVDGPGGDPSDDFVPGPALATPLGFLGTGAYDRAGNILYFTQLGGYIQKLDLNTNLVSTVAGNGIQILGAIDGPGGDLRDDLVDGGDPFGTFIGQPLELALHPGGDLVFFDRHTCRIRRLDFAQNRVFSYAGNGNCAFSGDGSPAAQAALSAGEMAFDAAGNLFLADGSTARIRRVDAATGIISTVAGDGTFGIPVSGSPLSTIGPVQALAFDSQSHLLITNGTDLMRISPGANNVVDGAPDETLTLINGCHTNCQQPFGGDGLPINDSQVFLATVQHMSVAQDGAVLLSDGFRVRRIQAGADGIVTGASDEIIQTVASYFDFRSNPPANFNGDTFATQSYLGPGPTPLEDNQGRIMVVDGNNFRVRRFGLAPPPVNPNSADLEMRASGSPDPLDTGDTLDYVVTVTNRGPAQATNVLMTYVMPGNVVFEGTSSRQGFGCTGPAVGSSGTVTCDFGTLASGGLGAVTIMVKPQAAGALSSSFSAAATEPDSDATNNAITVTTTVNLAPVVINVPENIVVSDTPMVQPSAMISVPENITVTDTPGVLPSAMISVPESIVVTDTPVATPVVPDLEISKVLSQIWDSRGQFVSGGASAGRVENGGEIDFGILVTNIGAIPFIGTITVTDTLPQGFTLGTRSGTPTPCSAVGQIVTCVFDLTTLTTGPLPPNTSIVFKIPVLVGSVAAPGQPVTLANTASLTAAPGDPNPQNNASSVSFTVTDVQDVTPPTLTLPANILAEATGPNGADVSYTATANDAVDGATSPSCIPASGSTFPLGSTTVNCTAIDAAGNSATGSFIITVQDTTPPVITVPTGRLIIEATGPLTVVNYTVSAIDLVDGPVPVVCTIPSGASHPVGGFNVACRALDNRGNQSTDGFGVLVQDTTSPVLSLPPNIVAEATGPVGAAVSYAAGAHDAVDGAITPNCAPASASTFALGNTPVNCTAADAAGNSSIGSFIVTVQDTTPPSGFPTFFGQVQMEATEPAGAFVDIRPGLAVDAVSGVVTPTCHPNRTVFPFTETFVTCTATDAAGNSTSQTFSIVVLDTTGPTLSLPANITVAATSVNGAVVNYSATANDLVSGAVTPACLPASGALFAVGTTTVNCTATDGAGSTSSGSFSVTVTAIITPPAGPPRLTGAITAKGRDSSGNYFVDLRLANTGTGNARGVRISSLSFSTLNGSGTVAHQSPAIPIVVGDIGAGQSATMRIFLTVPTTVLRFVIRENGSMLDAAGVSYNFSMSQAVIQ